MSNTPYIIKAPKASEVRMQEIVEMDFIMAILNRDIHQLNVMFCVKSTFQGKYNKWQILNRFKTYFGDWAPSASPEKVVQFYVAMGNSCGHRAILIDDGNFLSTKPGSKPKAIIIDSSEDRITDIRFTSNYTDIESYKKLTINN